MKRQLLPLFLLLFAVSASAQVGLPTFTYAGGSDEVGPEPAGLDVAEVMGTFTNRLPSVAFGDLNGDGLLDFVSGSRDAGGPVYFENTGTTTAPVWTQTALFTLDSINIVPPGVINEQKPTLEDIDNDGDLDLFLGSRSNYFSTFNFKLDDILYYENIGTPTAAIFTYSPDDLPALKFQQVAEFTGINFVDIDNDSDRDLVVMGSDSCSFFLNTGTLNNPSFERKLQSENPFEGIDALGLNDYLYSRPMFFDLDEDGDFDLYYQTESGDLSFIENTGTAAVPIFGATPRIITTLPEVGVFATFDMADVNGDGALDIVGGEFNPGHFYWYKGSLPLIMKSAIKNNDTQITLTFSANVQTNGTNPTDFTVTDGNAVNFTVTAQADGTAGDKEIVLTVADLTSALNGLTVTYTNTNNEISDLVGTTFAGTDATGVAVGGAFTTTFSGGIWDNGTPNVSYIAIVDQDYTSTNDMVFHSLTVNPGNAFTLDGHKATITTDLVLESGAAFFDNGTLDVSGNTIVKRATNTSLTSDFHLMSSPISDGNAENIYQASYAYRYVGGEYNNVYSFDNGVNLINGEGLAISGTGTGGITRSFSGTLNKEAFTYDLISTDQWHLLGNPYPTQMSLSAFHTANNTVLKPTMYFYNEDTGAYDTWNVNLSSGTGSATANVAVAQGFFAEELNTSAAQVAYTPLMRALATDAFLRTSTEDNSGQIKLAFGNSEILVAWNASASNQEDVNDASYLQGSAMQALFSIQEDKNLSIQAISNDFTSTAIPMGYYNYENGLRQISLEDVNANDEMEIILIDRYKNTMHNLNETPYEFMAEGTEMMVKDRFELVLTRTSLSVHDNETSGVVVIGGRSLQVFGDSNNPIQEVCIYSMEGRLIYEESKVNHTAFQWNANPVKGLYMITVTTARGMSNHKTLLK